MQSLLNGEQMNFEIPSALYTSDVFASISLTLVLLVAKVIAGRALSRRDDLTPQVARRWTANFRNVLLLVAVIGLIMIWAPQLRTFALSLTAIAIAIVVAIKELILCLSGAALRTFTRAFSVGDVIEVGTTKGRFWNSVCWRRGSRSLKALAARLCRPVARSLCLTACCSPCLRKSFLIQAGISSAPSR